MGLAKKRPTPIPLESFGVSLETTPFLRAQRRNEASGVIVEDAVG